MSNSAKKLPNAQSWLSQHPEVQELLHLTSAEDKLAFLMERQTIAGILPVEERTAENKIQGCLSGLWVSSERREELLWFRSASDSQMVGGIAGFLCDLFSGRSGFECLEVSEQEVLGLGIEPLLSLNRRHAVRKILDMVRVVATQCTAGMQRDGFSN